MKKVKQAGFTVIELIVFFVILVTLAIVFIVQKNDLAVRYEDELRKTAINAMYYDLTEVYYAEHKYYPAEISSQNLTAIDPALFTDPDGYTLDGAKCTYTDLNDEEQTDGDCNYRYEVTGCNGEGQCQNFKLIAKLAKEADFVKESPKSD
jgi:type II secretory pathway pseudopilin PulG